jgi:death-on-curing protein
LDSAIGRPRTAEHYEGADLFRQAALLAAGVSQAQAFLDGNKRTAVYVAMIFMEINGCVLRYDDLELARELEKVAERSDSLEAATRRFEAWLRVQEREGT